MQSKQHRIHALRWGTIALFGALVADLAEYAVDPTSTTDAAEVFDAATQHHGRMIASAIFLLASAVFIVPAAFALVSTLEDRGRRIGRVAAGLALLGGIGHAALAAIYLAWAAMPAGASTREEVIGAIDRMNSSGGVAIVTPFVVAFPLGLVALFLAMVRGRLAPRWVLLPVLAAPVVAIAGQSSSTISTSIAIVLLLVATGALARRAFESTRVERRASAEPAPA